MTQTWQPHAAATLIGSMPHRDRHHVIDLILREISDIPVWPQLSAYEDERMMIQYLEGLPGLRNDAGHITVATDDTDFDSELLAFYQDYMEVEAGTLAIETSRFQMGELTGKTFLQFVRTLIQTPQPTHALKGQVVGPFTLLTGLTDQQRKPLIYDERMRDAVAKHLALKARWQVEQLRPLGKPVIVFLDEPALAGYGSSAYIGVSAELVASLLDEVIGSIHQAGALAGIHVCANTDWLLVLQSQADIVNFDAYGYFDRFVLYRDAITTFLQKGRTIAWGLVPTSDPHAILQETAKTLADRWFNQVQTLTSPEFPVTRILAQSLFTPSCGCGSLTEDLAERVVTLTRSVSAIMQEHLAQGGEH
jgi:hypothetical protein